MRKFYAAQDGVVAVLAAVFTGMIGTALGGLIEMHFIADAKRDVQHALDQAALAGARSIILDTSPGGSADSQGRSKHRQDVSKTGLQMYEVMLRNDRVNTIAVSVKLTEDDVVQATATVEYKPFILKLMGIENIAIEALAHAAPGSESKTAPACFNAMVDGITVESGSSITAPDCGLASAAQIALGGASTTKLDCPDGTCDVADPYQQGLARFNKDDLPCNYYDNKAVLNTSTSYNGSGRFCNEVIVEYARGLSLRNGNYYFEKGLTVKSGGSLRGGDISGSALIMAPGTNLMVEPGATFTIEAYEKGFFPGIAIVALSNETPSTIEINIEDTVAVSIAGIVYAPEVDVTINGPGTLRTDERGLAIWAKSLELTGYADMNGAPTTVGTALPIVTRGVSAMPRLVR